jgi:alpha-galactosidase
MRTRLLFGITALAFCSFATAETVWLTSLDLKNVKQGYGEPQKDLNIIGKPLQIAGRPFQHGLGTHATMQLYVNVNGAKRFRAYVGIDDSAAAGTGSVSYQIIGDRKVLFETGIMRSGDRAREVDIDLRKVKQLIFKVGAGGDGLGNDHADWADARFDVEGAKPASIPIPVEKPYFWTPKPSDKPRINGPKVFGVHPGHPVMYTVPATGQTPLTYTAANLPQGLSLDPQNGQFKGSIAEKGEYVVKLTVSNKKGKAERDFKFVVGDTLALTPPMGWSTWYVSYTDISDTMVRTQADAMVNSGLASHGYSYINIDDGWNINPNSKDPRINGKVRDEKGNLRSNQNFPDMRGMCDYVHSRGLKIGMYISPGKYTCAGYAGSLGHEEQDAKQFAEWGFDFLKYDWCSYDNEAKDHSVPELRKPYDLMREAILKQDRDFVYNLCQYGMGEVWKWGRDAGGNFWRTTGDLGNEGDGLWGGMSAIGFGQSGYAQYAGPGGWNDPDNIIIGTTMSSGKLQPVALTPSEQYTYMTLWCMLAAPLVIATDMTQTEPITLSILSNDEVIEVNQDALGKQGYRVKAKGGLEVWAKDLEDGSRAIALFNRSDFETDVEVKWSDLGIVGKHKVRDLWKQRNLGVKAEGYKTKVRSHGAVLIKVS